MTKVTTLSAYLLLLCCLAGPASAQQFEWVKTAGGNGALTTANGAVSDKSGNIYTTGTFSETADFDPGSGVLNLAATGNATNRPSDVFLMKLDPAGNLVWVKQIGGNNADEARAIAIDTADNISIAGVFRDTADFDPGPGVANLIAKSGQNIFVAKYSSSGNLIWAARFEGTGSNDVTAIKADKAGNWYLGGSFQDTIDFDPGPGISQMISSGLTDAFVAKLDAAGNLAWAKQFAGPQSQAVLGLTIDGGGNVITAGPFQGTADFDPGAAAYNLTSAGIVNIFVSKLTGAGNFVWAKQMGGSLLDQPLSVTADNWGNIYTTGLFISQDADFDPDSPVYPMSGSNGIVFISKLDNDGHFRWAKQMGNSTASMGSRIVAAGSDLYILGNFGDTADFNPGPATNQLFSDASDIFVARLDTGGNYRWAGQIRHTGANNALYEKAITVDTQRSKVYIAGAFQDGADFDPNAGNAFAATAVAGNADMFLLKLDACSIDTGVSVSGALLTAGAAGASYQWISCNGNIAIAGATGQAFAPAVNGSYAVVITRGGCTDTSRCVTVTGLGIAGPADDSGITAAPNPATGKIALTMSRALHAPSVALFDFTGRQVRAAAQWSGNRCTIDLAGLAAGVYFAELRDQGNAYRIKVVKQ